MTHVTPSPLLMPTVHINGTSREALAEGYIEQIDAIREALRVLAENAPNPRDYYPQGREAFKNANDQQQSRLASLTAIYDELHRIAENIQ